MTLRIYDSNAVTVSFAGLPIEEPINGEFLRISWTSDAFVTTLGTNGVVTRAPTHDYRATIELELMQTSPSNTFLSGIWTADRNTRGGSGVAAFFVTDLNSIGTLYTAGNAWIRRGPDPSFSNEPGSRTWVFECDRLIDFTTGNL